MLTNEVQATNPINYVAWYGAVVATCSLLVSFFNFRRDSTKLKVRMKEMAFIEDTNDFKADEPLLMVEAINVGRRNISLEVAWFEMRDGQTNFMKSQWMPSSEISEGKSAAMFVRKKDLNVADIYRAVVRDETGRKWKGKFIKSRKTKTKNVVKKSSTPN